MLNGKYGWLVVILLVFAWCLMAVFWSPGMHRP